MGIKKFLVNLICGFIPSKNKRQQIRTKLMNENNLVSQKIDSLNGNKIVLVKPNGKEETIPKFAGLNIHFNGKNSVVKIHEPIKFKNCNFSLGNNCFIEIDTTKYNVSNFGISTRYSSRVAIGKNFSCCGCNLELHDEANSEISIGEDCQFSYGINIRTSDGHTIYEVESGKILNAPKDKVVIGNHVWLGMHTKILKDAHIADNTIVGACSVVTKMFDKSNVILAGTPAKIVKQGVNWDRRNTDRFNDGFVK